MVVFPKIILCSASENRTFRKWCELDCILRVIIIPNCCQFAILIGKLSPFLNSGSWISIGKYWCSTSAMTYPLLKSLRTFFVFPFRLNPSSHRHISRGNFDRGANSPWFTVSLSFKFSHFYLISEHFCKQ